MDRGRGVNLTGIRFAVYVGNIILIGRNRAELDDVMSELIGVLEDDHLHAHERTFACGQADVIGLEIRASELRVRTSEKRFWRLYKPLGWVLKNKRLSGVLMEKIIGHCTYVAMICRPLLSIFSSVYKFIRAKHREVPFMWTSVRSELWMLRSLMLLAESRWGLGWSPVCSVSDACPTGYGSGAARLPLKTVASVGRVTERSRSKRADLVGARAVALGRMNSADGRS